LVAVEIGVQGKTKDIPTATSSLAPSMYSDAKAEISDPTTTLAWLAIGTGYSERIEHSRES
jgi:hypothetical protein